ncbi:MAG: UDP-N-acetylmuramate--L-alanine ligase [Bacteroidales bacterium]|nr:UDP-N-acetylmuramate--L-alanine ligase [Bacteroidales bacterium]MDT8373033.1 UDP-N-acetylmuramate--L-alanine ligase [Bacteroidales bacterium]
MKGMTSISGIYFVGIGGIGMSALARYFISEGYTVCGYDRTESPLTDTLDDEGCGITFNDSVDSLPTLFSDPGRRHKVLVVWTPAVPKENRILTYFRENGYMIYKRAEILGMISRDTDAIAVAGTHGKTTVSTMIAHILSSSATGCSAFLGGISKNYDTNLLLEESRYTVMEADEFDRSFLHLSPLIAVVTSIDPDHLDIYGTAEAMVEAYGEFCHRVRGGGTLIINEEIISGLSLPDDVTAYSYGTGEGSSFRAVDIVRGEGYYNFSLVTPGGRIENLRLHVPGMVNILNATAAAAAAWCAGAAEGEIREALATYQGVRRRFDVRYKGKDIIYLDDYAHHPQEINALVSAVRDFWPRRKVTGIFQPHLYTRTRDFAEGFAAALDRLDEVLLLTLYPARENPIAGVSSDMIAKKMKNRSVRVVTREELLPALDAVKEGLLLTIGAGDIDRFIEPITEKLKERDA